jgi:type II secretory pathway pseudopilin PulG
MEVIVAVAIIALMVAVMLPSLSQQTRDAQSVNLTQNLKTINDAIQKYRENLGYYPSSLTLLTGKPTTSNTDACGAALTSTVVALWKGPYLTLLVGANGVLSGESTIQVGLTRVPATTSSSTVMDGELRITAISVSDATATDVDRSIDAGTTVDFVNGTVRYNAGADQLTWAMPISGC